MRSPATMPASSSHDGVASSSGARRATSACRSSTGQSGPCAMRHCPRGSTFSAEATIASIQRRRSAPSRQRARSASGSRCHASASSAAVRCWSCRRRRVESFACAAATDLVRAPPFLGKDFPHPRQGLGVRLAEQRRGASRGVGQDGVALRRPVTFDQRQQCLLRGVPASCFHAQLPAQARRQVRPRHLAARIRNDQDQRLQRHERRAQLGRVDARRNAPRTPAPAAPVRAPRRMPRRPRQAPARAPARLRAGSRPPSLRRPGRSAVCITRGG